MVSDGLCPLKFDNLDINVQEEFESFLRERGISEGLALFIPEYAEYKEQKVKAILIFPHKFSLPRHNI